jgi:uncharacterized protein (TIGR03437 family)
MRSSRRSLHSRISFLAVVASLLTSATAQVGGRLVIVNSATYAEHEPLAPSTLATAFGQFPGVMESHPAATHFPITLGNAQVLIGGTPAPLLYSSARQINFLVPPSVRPGASEIAVTVGGNPIASATVMVERSRPQIFLRTLDAARSAAVLNANGTLNTDENRAVPGELVTILVTGLGSVSDATSAGAMLALNRIDALSLVADVAVPGLWRLQIRVPEVSGQAPLAIYANGAASNTASVWIR